MAKISIVALPQFQKEIKQLIKKYISLSNDFENLFLSLEKIPSQANLLVIIVTK